MPGLRDPNAARPGQRMYSPTLISMWRGITCRVRGDALVGLGRCKEALVSYQEGLWVIEHSLEMEQSNSSPARIEQERKEFLVCIQNIQNIQDREDQNKKKDKEKEKNGKKKNKMTNAKMNGEGEYCNYCSKFNTKDSTKKLLVCGGCRSSRYCSKSCKYFISLSFFLF